MKRSILIIALLFATAFSAFAQIEDEILQSKAEKIVKGRAYLIEKFLDRDYDKVKEIKDYLLGIEDEYYVVLRPVELWHILQWTKEYDELTTLLRHTDSAYFTLYRENTYFSYSYDQPYNPYNNRIFPQWDKLGQCLLARGVEDRHLLQFGLQEADLSAEDRAFLTMFLDWLFVNNHYLTEDIQNDADQTKVNEKATRFLLDYPNSDYEWFVRHMIRKQYAEKDWGGGLGLDLRSGFTSGTLAKPGFGVGLSLDVLYKRLDLTIGIGVMTLKTAQNQVYSFEGVSGLVYPQGSECNWGMPYANLAYYVYDGRRVAFGPFVGIGGIFESYPFNKEKEDEYKELEKNFLLYKAGLNLDIKMHDYVFDRSSIRIKYEFGLIGNGAEKYSNVHLITIGWSWMGRGEKRVY